MKSKRTSQCNSVFCALLFALFLVALPIALAKAEMYVAGQIGVTLPRDATSVDFSGGPIVGPRTARANDLELKESVMYGAKVGYYFESLRWLGVETEVFHTTPHVRQQNLNLNGAPQGEQPGSYLRVLTWAPVNIVARYQMGQVEPYAGVGLGIFLAQLKDGGSGDTTFSLAPGLNTQLGLRYRITSNLAVFGEWKFNYARFEFEATDTAFPADIGATYMAHHLVFGIGFHL